MKSDGHCLQQHDACASIFAHCSLLLDKSRLADLSLPRAELRPGERRLRPPLGLLSL